MLRVSGSRKSLEIQKFADSTRVSAKAREDDARADRLIGGRENGQTFPICSLEPDADATFVS